MAKEKIRCAWCGTDPLYVSYHDTEWGVPVHDDKKLFEFLVLESFQAGLSWYIVLKKRPNFKKAFANFDPKKIALFTPRDAARLMQDAGIIRNRMKIDAAINNAARFLEIKKEFGSFSNYVWNFTNEKTIDGKRKTMKDYVSKSDISDAMSKDMGKRGFKFRGTTIFYAFMQAVGMVNDHMTDCFRYKEIRGFKALPDQIITQKP
jgi:DNA-3-methyladenine glycosylase I